MGGTLDRHFFFILAKVGLVGETLGEHSFPSQKRFVL